MKHLFSLASAILLGIAFQLVTFTHAQDAPAAAAKTSVAELDQALNEAKEGASDARKRLAVRRVIRDAETLSESLKDKPERYPILEFVFRARKQLIALDDDAEHRKALLDTCRELIKAPDEFADLRIEADLLLSQADAAKNGSNAEARSEALRPFVDRYVETPAGPKVVRMAMLMALELGDNKLVDDLQELITKRYAGDLEMISFQRDKLGGQVVSAPFVGTIENTEGKILRFPMDVLGRTTMLVFWSKADGGEALLKGLAAAALEQKTELSGRLEFISINLDGLPDHGESIVRSHGVDWQVLRFPGGKENPIYKSYVRVDPRIITISPTGYTALVMVGSTRQKEDTGGEPDYARMFQSSLGRSWTQPRYVAQLTSLMAGEFLIFDPEGKMDPARPPEWKAIAKSGDTPLSRGADSVPEETLFSIQDCFVAPPQCYRLTQPELIANYTKAVELCRKAIAEHPKAPDLWIVRNRLMVALIGLWRVEAKLAHFDAAIAEAKSALSAGYPAGCDLIARLCIARSELRDPKIVSREWLDKFVQENGGDNASGPVLAAASMLAIDVAERGHFEKYRERILKDHTESPMMWVFTSFLLDRYHDYWLFQVPFSAGWSFGRREDYFMTKGNPETANRMVRTELKTLEGKILRIPEDLDSQSTAIIFAKPGPWSKKRDDGLPPSPERLVQAIAQIAAKRPGGDLKVILAFLGEDTDAIRASLAGLKTPLTCPIMMVPGGSSNPLVQRIGILSEDTDINSLLIEKNGRIAAFVSGLCKQTGRSGTTLTNVVEYQDEMRISELIASDKVQEAKELILGLAPVFDPEALDAKGKKILKKPEISLPHLRARARVYLALGNLDLALADAEEVVERQLGTDGGMSLRTDELDESEALKALIQEKTKGKR